MAEVLLKCISPEAAEEVVTECVQYGGLDNIVRLGTEPDTVLISYYDKRYPLDVADWAHENGHAHDADAARVIASL